MTQKGFGRQLPGMVAVDKNVSTGFTVSEKLEAILPFSTDSIIKVTVEKTILDGERITCEDSIAAETKLSAVRASVSSKDGGVFLLFGQEEKKNPITFAKEMRKKCLIVSFVPEEMKVRTKMLVAGSKGVLKSHIKKMNDSVFLEEYHCTELKEISLEAYQKKIQAEKPWTEFEKQKMEEAKMEKVQGDNIIARLMGGNAPPAMLPGFGLGMKPSEIKKNRAISMKVASEKEGQRLERVNFFKKLKEEKKKMEQEKQEEEARKRREQAEAVADDERNVEDIEPEVDQPVEREVSAKMEEVNLVDDEF